jgi:hypothetical protein
MSGGVAVPPEASRVGTANALEGKCRERFELERGARSSPSVLATNGMRSFEEDLAGSSVEL